MLGVFYSDVLKLLLENMCVLYVILVLSSSARMVCESLINSDTLEWERTQLWALTFKLIRKIIGGVDYKVSSTHFFMLREVIFWLCFHDFTPNTQHFQLCFGYRRKKLIQWENFKGFLIAELYLDRSFCENNVTLPTLSSETQSSFIPLPVTSSITSVQLRKGYSWEADSSKH